MSEDTYSVEDILDKRVVSGKTEYLIKWSGYSLNDSTWEPVTHLNKNCDRLIKKFEKKTNKKRSTLPKFRQKKTKKRKISSKKKYKRYNSHLEKNDSTSEEEQLSNNEDSFSYDEKIDQITFSNNYKNHKKLKEIIQKVKKESKSKRKNISVSPNFPYFQSGTPTKKKKGVSHKRYLKFQNEIEVLKKKKSFSQSTNYKNPFDDSNSKKKYPPILELSQSENDEIVKKEESFKKENITSFQNNQNELKEILNLSNNKISCSFKNNDNSIISKRTPTLKNLNPTVSINNSSILKSFDNNSKLLKNSKESKKVRFKDEIQNLGQPITQSIKDTCPLFFNNLPGISKNTIQFNNIENKPIDSVLNTSFEELTIIKDTGSNQKNSNKKSQIIELEVNSEHSKNSAQIQPKQIELVNLNTNNSGKSDEEENSEPKQIEYTELDKIELKKNVRNPFQFHISPIKFNSHLNDKYFINENNETRKMYQQQLSQYKHLIESYSNKIDIFTVERESKNENLSNFSNQTLISNEFQDNPLDNQNECKVNLKKVKVDVTTDVDDLEAYKISNFTIRPTDKIEICNTLIYDDKLYLKVLHNQKFKTGKELTTSLFILPEIIKRIRPDLLCSFYEKHMNFV